MIKTIRWKPHRIFHIDCLVLMTVKMESLIMFLLRMLVFVMMYMKNAIYQYDKKVQHWTIK